MGGGTERDGQYYLDMTNTLVDDRVHSASVSPIQQHHCLYHPSLSKAKQILPLKVFCFYLRM